MTIVANLATYPPRRASLTAVVERIAPQVDCLNVVLNEYTETIPELAQFENVRQILPPSDTKDAGKFFPDVSGAQYVLMIDDDVIYPDDYVRRTVERFSALGASGFAGSYHGSLYYRPRPGWRARKIRDWLGYSYRRIADHRWVSTFFNDQKAPLIVDQLATNAAILRGADFPPYSYMKDSQKFVDVRLARWCFEHELTPVTLPREANWLRPIRYDETIFNDFTRRNPEHVSREIASYAFKVAGRGHAPKGM